MQMTNSAFAHCSNCGEDYQVAAFNPQTNAITMELDVQDNRGEADHYSIQGKVDGKKMSGTWTRNNGNGDFKISKE